MSEVKAQEMLTIYSRRRVTVQAWLGLCARHVCIMSVRESQQLDGPGNALANVVMEQQSGVFQWKHKTMTTR